MNASNLASHMLSFDVEEYFQVEAAAEAVHRNQWSDYQKRLTPCVERILKLLSDHQATATFFVLGWVARHERDLIRKIVDAGHEIASHGMDHRMLQHFSPASFERDLLESRKLLEDISGRAVLGYRAPTFSITRQTSWALDVLAEAGFLYDSSVFPIRHDRYGVPDAPRAPHFVAGPGGSKSKSKLLEIPPLTLPAFGATWPVGGGGYLRLLPVRLIGRALKIVQSQGQPAMIYLHPWELDPDQPILPMPRTSRWRHRIGLHRTEAKLTFLLRTFRFASVQTLLPMLSKTVREQFDYSPA